MRPRKPLASLSLDLDNKWTYMKTHGDPGWDSFPTYLDIVVPRVLDFLAARGLTITFFLVGQDAALERNWAALQAIARAGHEVGNHSYWHEPWLHLYSEEQVEAELTRTEEALERVTGQRPIGFRGPGYSLSSTVLRVLARKGYRYDASTLPSFLGPLARMYYFMTARALSPEEKRQRSRLFGSFQEGFRPLQPYQWSTPEGDLIEIPVTTAPLVRVPIHLSYVIYLSSFSFGLALAYFRMALLLCRLTGTAPSLLLHPLDFLGGDEVPELVFFPGMRIPIHSKLKLAGAVVDSLCAGYEVVTIRQHAKSVARCRGWGVKKRPS